MTRSNSGQGTVEMVLLTATLVIVASLIFKTMRSQGFVTQLVDGPWSIMSGMIENGVWGSSEKTRNVHPNYLRRHISLIGKEE
jgi:hypothetical protein